MNEAAVRRQTAKVFSPVLVDRFIPDITWRLVY
jgi:hypothetical protein